MPLANLSKKQIRKKKGVIGLIRVATFNDDHLLNLHGKIIEEKFPELKVITKCIENQPKGIYSFESEKEAIPKIISTAKILKTEGVQAIVVSCANDPGVKILKKTMKMPIIGAGSACASLAFMLGERIGILGITDFPPSPMVRILGEKLIAYEKPRNVNTAFDLAKNEQAIFEAAERLISQDVDVLALGCTGFSTFSMANKLEERFNVKVIDPVVAAGAYAHYVILMNN